MYQTTDLRARLSSHHAELGLELDLQSLQTALGVLHLCAGGLHGHLGFCYLHADGLALRGETSGGWGGVRRRGLRVVGTCRANGVSI